MNVEYEQRRRQMLKDYETSKDATLKQLEFVQSIEFDMLIEEEKEL